MDFFNTRVISYLSKIELKSPFFLLDPISNSTLSGLMPQDRSTMLMWMGIGTLGGVVFFQVELENSLHKK